MPPRPTGQDTILSLWVTYGDGDRGQSRSHLPGHHLWQAQAPSSMPSHTARLRASGLHGQGQPRLHDLLQGHGTESTCGVEHQPHLYGPIYLFQERHDRKKSKIYDNEGHHFVTVQGMTVAFTRCWKWQKGFQGDPSTKERTDKMLQANVAAITLEVSERDTSGVEHSSQRQGAQPAATSTARGQPDAPKPEDITTFVSEGIRDNTSHHGACRGLELPQRLDGAGCA